MTPLGTMNWMMSTRALARAVSSCRTPGEGCWAMGSLALGAGGVDCPLPLSRAAFLPSPGPKQKEMAPKVGLE